MPDLLPDRWSSRDLPILREVVRIIDEDPTASPSINRIAERTGLDVDTVAAGAVALATAGLVDGRGAMGRPILRFTGISSEARRLVGVWPTAESAYERLLAALEQQSTQAPREEDRSTAKTLLHELGTTSRDLGVTLLGAAITGQLPQSS